MQDRLLKSTDAWYGVWDATCPANNTVLIWILVAQSVHVVAASYKVVERTQKQTS